MTTADVKAARKRIIARYRAAPKRDVGVSVERERAKSRREQERKLRQRKG
jgi:hypothetical protein